MKNTETGSSKVNTTTDINISIARAITDNEALMDAINLTANNAESYPQDAHEIADAIRGIVTTLVHHSINGDKNDIARIVAEADALYDPREIAAEVAWSVTLI